MATVTLKQGETWRRRVSRTVDDVVQDWSSCSARATFARSNDPLLTLTSPSGGITLSADGADLTLTPAQTLAMPEGLIHMDIRLVEPDQDVVYTAIIPILVERTHTRAASA